MNVIIARGFCHEFGFTIIFIMRIDFILKKNFQGDIERLTAYATGSTHIFKDTGIISNSSIKPGAIGSFQIIIPKSIGNFIGYSYELHWDHYE